jgi:hypothetical protein
VSEPVARVIRLRLKVSNNAAVAQRIRASVYGTEGRGFESLQPHSKTPVVNGVSGSNLISCLHHGNVMGMEITTVLD